MINDYIRGNKSEIYQVLFFNVSIELVMFQ